MPTILRGQASTALVKDAFSSAVFDPRLFKKSDINLFVDGAPPPVAPSYEASDLGFHLSLQLPLGSRPDNVICWRGFVG